MKKKKYDDDDGRQVADMSDLNVSVFGFNSRRKATRRKGIEKPENTTADFQPLTKEETRWMMFRATGMSLLIALVFIAGAALFILFCILIWFK